MIERICSFGAKFGKPAGGYVYDLQQKIRNPFYVPELRLLSGIDLRVRQYLDADPETHRWFLDILSEASRVDSATLWIGCKGGRHRSVYMAERVGKALTLPVQHRDLVRRVGR